MISPILTLIVALLPIILTLWILQTYFPNALILLKAFIIAAVVIFFIRIFHAVTCEFLCGRFIP